jgi:excisionase family DNA binding protein
VTASIVYEDEVSGPYPRLLRLEDIADRLAVSRSMAWKLIPHGHLRSVRIGRAVRVRPEDLEAYIAGAIREV